ncbi:uncharacterized protein LOC116561333 [Sapajus apella]|uniref:Uncharacterized protein LOC116561333 n=1 Tax=Sapajus apella TaxID=9515 RepID=A0A6J3J2C4_SAPAP|nr:uncharacterized protein LOC116561333 [Sapajus apella]
MGGPTVRGGEARRRRREKGRGDPRRPGKGKVARFLRQAAAGGGAAGAERRRLCAAAPLRRGAENCSTPGSAARARWGPAAKPRAQGPDRPRPLRRPAPPPAPGRGVSCLRGASVGAGAATGARDARGPAGALGARAASRPAANALRLRPPPAACPAARAAAALPPPARGEAPAPGPRTQGDERPGDARCGQSQGARRTGGRAPSEPRLVGERGGRERAGKLRRKTGTGRRVRRPPRAPRARWELSRRRCAGPRKSRGPRPPRARNTVRPDRPAPSSPLPAPAAPGPRRLLRHRSPLPPGDPAVAARVEAEGRLASLAYILPCGYIMKVDVPEREWASPKEDFAGISFQNPPSGNKVYFRPGLMHPPKSPSTFLEETVSGCGPGLCASLIFGLAFIVEGESWVVLAVFRRG